jgi:hypothetical protein
MVMGLKLFVVAVVSTIVGAGVGGLSHLDTPDPQAAMLDLKG